jgi:hypothetical protein
MNLLMFLYSGWAATPVSDMTQGLALAERIVYDLRDMNPAAWGELESKAFLPTILVISSPM